jgi:peptidyl-prolyl cis-trans isomerase SurA
VQRYFKTIPADSLPLIGEQLQYSQIMIEPQVRESERQRVINTLDSLRNRLASGRGSMMLEASKWSEDPGSKYKGGCYPMQRKGSFVPEYEAAVASTPEGSYSPVFKSEYGYHIVKVIEKRGEYYESCHILISPKIVSSDLDIARNKLDTVRFMLAEDSLSFSKAAIKYSTEENTRNAGGRVMNNATGGTKHDVAQLPAELNLVLMDLKVGEISEPILTSKPDGSQAYTVYHLDARTPAHVANLKDDYEIFQNVAENDAKQKEIDKWVKKKLASTYSSIHEDYKTCSFQFPWGIEQEKK